VTGLQPDQAEIGLRGCQGVSASNLFQTGPSGKVEAKLEVLDIPVRAIVFKFQEEHVKNALQKAAQDNLGKLVSSKGIWFQDSDIYHSTVYHASTHQHPVAATPHEVRMELAAIAEAATSLCPLRVVLERVLVTGSGVVVAAWQVMSGAEPSTIRSRLLDALPRAPPPDMQTVREPDILYTTVARLLEAPVAPATKWMSHSEQQSLLQAPSALHDAAEAMTEELCGIEARIDSMWFVEEIHLLALALRGLHNDREIQMRCA